MDRKIGVILGILFIVVLFAPMQDLWAGTGGFNDLFDTDLAGIPYFEFQQFLFHNLWIIICIVAIIALLIVWRGNNNNRGE